MAKRATTNAAGYLRPSTLAGVPIDDHDGLPVTDCAGTITGLQGGFSESARMEKIHVPIGSKVVGLWWGEAVSHEYDRIKEGSGKDATLLDEFTETTVYKADAALLIDPDDFAQLIEKHNARVAEERSKAEAAQAAARGAFQLPDPVGDAGSAGPGPSGVALDGAPAV